MSNIEKARRNLKIVGYQHPAEVVSFNNKKLYKTFNSEKKDDYTKSIPISGYATFSNKQDKGCPQCGRDSLYECDCPLKTNNVIKVMYGILIVIVILKVVTHIKTNNLLYYVAII